MFTMGPNYNKLKTNLRLSINRLKLLEKKKTELALKARKEIADYISIHKEDRARIRVEHIIREDFLVEAYELLEMYCDLLLARFGLITQMKDIDPGLEEAIASVIWAAPRVWTDVQEFKIVSDQFAGKYGKEYVQACREDKLHKVNEKLLNKMAVQAPPKVMVEKYMIEIAKSHNVAFKPDMNILRDDEVAQAEAMLIDFQNKGEQGYGYQYPPVTTDLQFPTIPGAPDFRGPGPGPPPSGGGGGGGGGGTMGPMMPQPPAGFVHPHPQFNYGPPPGPNYGAPQDPNYGGATGGPVGPPPEAFNYPTFNTPNHQAPPIEPKIAPSPGNASAPDASMPVDFNLPEVPPNVPVVNNDNAGGDNDDDGGNDLDFDDLSRRFEELKKKR